MPTMTATNTHGHNHGKMQSQLAFNEMTMGLNGSVMNKEEKISLREKNGYCKSCQGLPILLYDIKRHRMNPLWVNKEPRAIAGECKDGICFVCYPDSDPWKNYNRKHPNRKQKPPGQGERNSDPSLQARGARDVNGHSSSLPHARVAREVNGHSSSLPARINPIPVPISPSPSLDKAIIVTAEVRAAPFPDNAIIVTAEAIPVNQRRESAAAPPVSPASLPQSSNASRGRSSTSGRTKPSFSGVFVPDSVRQGPASNSNIESSSQGSEERPRAVEHGNLHVSHSQTSLKQGPASNSNIESSSQGSEECPRAVGFWDFYGSHSETSLSFDSSDRASIAESQNDISSEYAPPRDSPSQTHARPVSEEDVSSSSRSCTSAASGQASELLPQQSNPSQTSPVPPASSPPTSAAASQQEIGTIIGEVDSLVKEMTAMGSGEFVADIILGTMRTHSAMARVQTYCLRVIWDLCKDDDSNKDAIMSAGAPEDIIRALKEFPDDASVQEKGCGAIWSLGATSGNRVVLIRQGACTQIIKALQNFIPVEALARTAIGAMRTLSPESEARDVFRSMGASKSTAWAMAAHRSCVSVQRDGCAFLSNVAVNIEKQYVTVVPLDEIDAVVQAIVHHREDVSVLQGACFALKNYCHEDKNCRTMRQCKGIFESLEHVSTYTQSPKSQTDACDIMERLQVSRSLDETLEDEAYMKLLHKVDSHATSPQVPRSILDFMRNYDWSPRLVGLGLQMFRRVVTEQESHRDHLYESGMIKDIIRYCQQFKENEFVCEEACALISCLAKRERHHQAIIEAGSCTVIFKSLECNNNSLLLVKHALEALKLMSTNFDCFVRVHEKMHLVTDAMKAHPTSETVQMTGIAVFSSILPDS